MSDFVRRWRERLTQGWSRFSKRQSLDASIANARRQVRRACEGGRVLAPEVVDPILRLARKGESDPVSQEEEREFYIAYGLLNNQISDIGLQDGEDVGQPFENAVSDAEQLLQHAASVGVGVPDEVVLSILNARTALATNTLTSEIRALFYGAYTKLSGSFGAVTAETIRNCSSRGTRRHLRRLRSWALITTGIVALMSIFTFMTDQTSKQITQGIKSGNELAAQLRDGLFEVRENKEVVDQKYAQYAPCDLLADEPSPKDKTIISTDDITLLQSFAANTRDLRSNAIKLNSINKKFPLDYNECDPFASCLGPVGTRAEALPKASAEAQLELKPAIKNYVAEALCKIKTFQEIRSFANNVNSNYTAIYGALFSYALPILYALLGAWAYQLRSFSDAVQKKIYRRSFSDSARIITAVIAGSIVGLFNPAKSLEFSPLATAFLVGYGVEIFFRFLDSLMNAFGSGSGVKPSS